MINAIIKFCARNRFMVFLFTAVAVLGGWYSLRNTKGMFFGLVPIMWSAGAGADVMKRIAAPIIGGILTSFILELVVYPPIFAIWKGNPEVKREVKQAGLLS